MRGSKAKRLHFLRDQLTAAGLRVPAKARRMPAWLARYEPTPRPPVAATGPAASPHRRAPQPPRSHRGGLKARGRTDGPSEKTLGRQAAIARQRAVAARRRSAFSDHPEDLPATPVEVAGEVL